MPKRAAQPDRGGADIERRPGEDADEEGQQ